MLFSVENSSRVPTFLGFQNGPPHLVAVMSLTKKVVCQLSCCFSSSDRAPVFTNPHLDRTGGHAHVVNVAWAGDQVNTILCVAVGMRSLLPQETTYVETLGVCSHRAHSAVATWVVTCHWREIPDWRSIAFLFAARSGVDEPIAYVRGPFKSKVWFL